MVISQKAKIIFSSLYIYYIADNFITNYDFLHLGKYQKRNIKIFQLVLIQGEVIEGRPPCKLS